MRQGTQSGEFMQIVIALLIAGGAIWWIAVEKTKPAGPNDLKVEVGNLRSYVSEAGRLIEQAEAGKITENFFRIEIEMLHEKIQGVREAIGAEKPQANLAGRFAAAHALSLTGEEALDKLQPLFNQPQQMNAEKVNLEEIFQQAVALEKSLLQ